MKMKVLSPAGNMESLRVAINNGADEVYLGINDYNARNNIDSFSLSNLEPAVGLAHLHNVRVFLAINILFTNDELQSALDTLISAYNMGVDAFIIQDIGFANLIHTNYPNIELHASTQMGVHNLEGVIEAEKLGFSRVVLSRETPLDEIKRIHDNSNVEIEYFVQGALCVSFSGNCYMSSYLFDASGNRGKCKQLCRLPYTLTDGDKEIKQGYLLSAKDFNMINRLKELEDAGVTSLKIEGRARRPYYVGVATKMYRDAVDGTCSENNDIELAFNRGYTEGYFNGNSGIISNRQNHIGIKIGEVVKFNSGKKFNEIYFTSDRTLNPKSTFKFINDKDEVVITAYDMIKYDGMYKITSTSKVNTGDKVHIINDYDLETEMLNTNIKRNIDIKIIAKINSPICAKFILSDNEITVLGDNVEEAKSCPLTEKDFVDTFKKNEYFDANLTLDIDNIFMAKSKLNEFRRSVFDRVFQELTKKPQPLEPIKLKPELLQVEPLKDFHFTAINSSDYQEKNIIYCPEQYLLDDIKLFITKCKSNNKTPILNLPNFALSADIKMLKNIVDETKITIIANNLYALDFKTDKISGGGLNIYNNLTANYFNSTYLTSEQNNTQKMPYMTLRHCPMKEHLHADCTHCSYHNGYKYKMQNGNTFNLKRVKMSTCTFYLTD